MISLLEHEDFCGLIYQKLGVSTRAEALNTLNKAAELGDIK